MTEAPERIWIEDEFGDGDDDQWTYGTWDVRNYAGYNFEYVRADIVQALTADFARQVQRTDEQREAYEQALSVMEAERDRLRGAIEYVLDGYGLKGPDYRFQCGEEEADWITDHLIAALKGESQ